MSTRDLTNETGYIYKITSPNGDVYIGQTINLKNRKYSYRNNRFKKQTKLWNSVQKYEWCPVDTFEVIEECLCGKNKCYIDEREIYWISYYDSFNDGLNCTEGGKGQLSKIWTKEQRERQSELITEMYNNGDIDLSTRVFPKMTEEHKEKIRQANKEYHLNNEHWNKGKITSDEVKQKIINSTIGEKNHFYGKTHTDEVREKMSKSHIGVKLSEERKKKMSESHLRRDKTNDRKHTVSVSQYDLDGNFIKEFSSIKEASLHTCSSAAGIVKVCKGVRKSTNNFVWKYN